MQFTCEYVHHCSIYVFTGILKTECEVLQDHQVFICYKPCMRDQHSPLSILAPKASDNTKKYASGHSHAGINKQRQFQSTCLNKHFTYWTFLQSMQFVSIIASTNDERRHNELFKTNIYNRLHELTTMCVLLEVCTKYKQTSVLYCTMWNTSELDYTCVLDVAVGFIYYKYRK